ncbi:M15 family metallopeptidase [Mucilaginibacter myungsuensis]
MPKNFLLGRYDPARDTSFCKVDHIYTERAVYLKKKVYTAYKRMYAAALKDGIKLNIISGTRTFNDQCYKWGSKWTADQFAHLTDKAARSEQLLRWWSMPGTSRHHWGSEMDLVNLKLAFFKTAEGKRVYNWLVTNAPNFGFQQPFNAGRTTGYQEEKWHWSYVPLAKIYLAEYVKQISYRDINGFSGCEAAQKLDVINNRVLAVNGACR